MVFKIRMMTTYEIDVGPCNFCQSRCWKLSQGRQEQKVEGVSAERGKNEARRSLLMDARCPLHRPKSVNSKSHYELMLSDA